jgi:hypothetical protein
MKTVTIVFRGLMVFSNQPQTMEIGLVDAPFHDSGHTGAGHPANEAHVPRILSMKDGVLAEVMDLRLRPELGAVRNWELVVTDTTQAVTTETQGATFDRKTHAFDRDFRFITDLEGPGLHDKPLSAEINTRQLLMVLYVHHGNFYTKLLSPPLKVKQVQPPTGAVPYGKAAAVVGCDITFQDTGTLKLMAGGTAGVVVKEFQPGMIYEISNAPPDVPFDEPTPETALGHFHMYYDKLFIAHPPAKQFDLLRDDGAPAPDPALCGVTFLSRRTDPL